MARVAPVEAVDLGHRPVYGWGSGSSCDRWQSPWATAWHAPSFTPTGPPSAILSTRLPGAPMRARPASTGHLIGFPGLLLHSSTHRAGVGGHEGQDPGLGAAGPPEAVGQIPTRAPLPAAVAHWPPLLFLPHRSIPRLLPSWSHSFSPRVCLDQTALFIRAEPYGQGPILLQRHHQDRTAGPGAQAKAQRDSSTDEGRRWGPAGILGQQIPKSFRAAVHSSLCSFPKMKL